MFQTDLSQGFDDSGSVRSEHFQLLFILQSSVGHNCHQRIADVVIRFTVTFQTALLNNWGTTHKVQTNCATLPATF